MNALYKVKPIILRTNTISVPLWYSFRLTAFSINTYLGKNVTKLLI